MEQTETDLEQINSEFDKIYTDNKKIASVLTNHTKILKLILDSSSVNHRELLNNQIMDRKLARNLRKGFHTIAQDSFIDNKLLVAALMIDETSEDVDTAINAISDGKHGFVDPQILSPTILKNTIKEFEEKQRTRFHFDKDERNYQHIIDISQLSVAI